jgi:hypothetical protein
MNQPTPPFNGAGAALYGPRGPQRAHNLGRRAKDGPPQSIADHIDAALAHVAGLNSRQRLAIRNTMLTMTRDISFIRMIADQTHGPYSEAAVRADDGWPPR